MVQRVVIGSVLMGVDVGARGRTTVRAGASFIAALNVIPTAKVWWDGAPVVASLLLLLTAGVLALTFYLLRAIPQMRVYEDARRRFLLASHVGGTGGLILLVITLLLTWP
jgi:hypothetical protein